MSENNISQKQPITENRRLAKCVAAGVIALTILIMGPVKLSGLRKDAVNVFRYGTSTKYTVSVMNDIRQSANSANILAGMFEAVLGESDDIKQYKEIAKSLLESNDETELLSGFYSLKLLTDDLYTKYLNSSPADAADAKKQYDVIKSAFTTIGNDSYQALASSFNDTRSEFPANVLSALGGVSTLPTSGGN